MTQNSDLELRMMLHDWDKNTFHDRLKRYKYLVDLEDFIAIPALDGLTPHYKDEAGACYVQGNFVASIVMVGLTVDAFLRSIFRSKYHESNYELRNKRHLDDLNFSQLFDEALAEGYITEDECKTLYHIRKDVCEPYMQTRTNLINDSSIPLKSSEELISQAKDEDEGRIIKKNKNKSEQAELGNRGQGIPSFHLQEFKITDPWLVGGKGVEKEAREVLYLLAKLLPNIIQRQASQV